MWTSLLLDGTLAECDRLGDGRADYPHKHRRYGVNVQMITDPDGRLLWLSPALPGRAHDLTAARTHRIIRNCERQGVPILTDLAYQGGGPWVSTRHQTQAPARTQPPREERQPGPGRGAGTGRTRRRSPEVLAHLPQIPMQPEPHEHRLALGSTYSRPRR